MDPYREHFATGDAWRLEHPEFEPKLCFYAFDAAVEHVEVGVKFIFDGNGSITSSKTCGSANECRARRVEGRKLFLLVFLQLCKYEHHVLTNDVALFIYSMNSASCQYVYWHSMFNNTKYDLY